MVQVIEEPAVPFVGPIKGGIVPGTMVRIQGRVPENADKFNINLHCGSPPSDIALHVSVRLLQNYIARNSFIDGDWGDEDGNGDLPIGLGQNFEILILCDPGSYKIAVNGNHFCEFKHRIPFNKVTHMEIDGTVVLRLLAFEGVTSAPPPPSPRMGGDADMPPGYTPPPPGNYGYGPQPGQGPFGGGPGRYPHHKRDDEEESGLDSFLGNAGAAIAGAMVSGLAENLLGGLTGQSQRHPSSHQPQNPTYNQGAHNQGSGSIVGDILESLTGGGGQQHQRGPPPHQQNPMFNQGGQHQQGGGSIVGDILESLATEMLRPSRRN